MTDDVADLMDRLVAGLPDTSPRPGLVVEGRLARRRRRQRVVLASAVAVVLVAASGVVGAELVHDDGRTAGVAPAHTAPSTPVPAPPPGMKWVGQDRTVVAVPVDWPVDDSTECGSTPTSVGVGSTEPCPESTGFLARVQVGRADVDSEEAGGSSGCKESLPPWCFDDAALGGVRVRAYIHTMDAVADMDRIFDSMRLLPDGWTTVPFARASTLDERVEQYEAAGFDVVVSDRDRIVGSAVTVEPGLATPIEEGGTVTLSPAASEEVQMYATAAVLRPGQEFGVMFPTELPRGLGFVMRGDGGMYPLLASLGDEDPSWFREGQTFTMEDPQVNGPGPDRLVVPDVAPPGTYRLCVMDHTDLCTTLTVVTR